MSPTSWREVPDEVRAAVAARTGPVAAAVDAGSGAHSDLAVAIDTDAGRVFVKGIRAGHRAAWTLRNQIAAGPHLPASVTPRLLWYDETAGWLLAAFEHVDGRAPDLAPGSTDLPVLAAALDDLAAALTPPPVQVAPPLAWRWGRLPGWALLAADPELTAKLDDDTRALLPHAVEVEATAPGYLEAGDTLAHTDPVPANILLTEAGPRFIDWSFPGRAPAWVDTAFLTIRLVDAGHTPQQAHTWAQGMPAYAAAEPAAIAAFTTAAAGLWTYRAHTSPSVRQRELAAVARTVIRHHLAHA